MPLKAWIVPSSATHTGGRSHNVSPTPSEMSMVSMADFDASICDESFRRVSIKQNCSIKSSFIVQTYVEDMSIFLLRTPSQYNLLNDLSLILKLMKYAFICRICFCYCLLIYLS